MKTIATTTSIPFLPLSQEVFLSKYAKGNEKSMTAVNARVAAGLAQAEKKALRKEYQRSFFDIQESGCFIPAGRIKSACGTDVSATLNNCYVQSISDSLYDDENGEPSIYTALKDAALTIKDGGGVGYSFSEIRPKGALIGPTQSVASGPLSYMRLFDVSCGEIKSAGNRRGAQMATLEISHPDIEEFIKSKNDGTSLTNFNISVGMKDDFMEALKNGDETYELVHKRRPGEEIIKAGARQRQDGLWIYKTVNPKELWDQLMQSTYDWAEPGIMFLDRMNEENPLSYLEKISTTNPCGEQPLPPSGTCCLGSMNLVHYVQGAFSESAVFDFDRFADDVAIAVRMLDNTLTVTKYPHEAQRLESESKRRIGLGITGLGSTLAMLQLKYSSAQGRAFAKRVATTLTNSSYLSSIELAKEKGGFPLFDKGKYLASPFIKRLPKSIQAAIAKHGIRNALLTSIAPTGTISLTFGNNVSSGLEPIFAISYLRNVIQPDGSSKPDRVSDYAYRVYCELHGETAIEDLPDYFETAETISTKGHLDMCAVFSPYIDSAISKTINVDENCLFDDFKNCYLDAYSLGLKGVTTYRSGCKRGAVLITKPKFALPVMDDHPDRKVTIPKPINVLETLSSQKRPETPFGSVAHNYYVGKEQPFLVSISQQTLEDGTVRPFEIWITGSAPSALSALAKNLSMDCRLSDTSYLANKLESLKKTTGNPITFDLNGKTLKAKSEVSALAQIIEQHYITLNAFSEPSEHSAMNALFSKKEKKVGADGTMAFVVDVKNPATSEDFKLFLPELEIDGVVRPYSVWAAGDFPLAMKGIMKSLSIDLRVMDLQFVEKKLNSLKSYEEPNGSALFFIPGKAKQKLYPSTLAYVADVIYYRFQMLGLFSPTQEVEHDFGSIAQSGSICKECHNHTVIKKDGCDWCSSCCAYGECG